MFKLSFLHHHHVHYSRPLMYPFWLKDYLSDPRVFHNAGRTLARRREQLARLSQIELAEALAGPPRLALSFDIERDMSQSFESALSQTARPFLEAYHRAGAPPATFFVQGEMIPGLADVLTKLAGQGHEIGLHGYSHELWGRTNWITRHPPVTPAERERRLGLSLANFRRAGLPRPRTFRAPNFTIDQATYRLLVDYGFEVDSSWPTQRGNLYRPQRRDGLVVLPVSCAPVPQIYYHPRLKLRTALHFAQFNFGLYVSKPAADLTETLEQTWRFQLAQRVRPHLLMYAHNWEFYDQAAGQPAITPAFEQLVANSRAFIQKYRLETVTVSQLARYLFEEEHSSWPNDR